LFALLKMLLKSTILWHFSLPAGFVTVVVQASPSESSSSGYIFSALYFAPHDKSKEECNLFPLCFAPHDNRRNVPGGSAGTFQRSVACMSAHSR
jgi:hypothetical protein